MSPAAAAVLRALSRSRGKPTTGDAILERVFAMTSEVPLDPDTVCTAVRELAEGGHVTVDRSPPHDHGFDFATITVTPSGDSAL